MVFTSRGAFTDRKVEVKCGQCLDCRRRRAREWAIRLKHESQMHERNCTLTLTYDEEHLPDDGGLQVRHWQNFAKAVRREIGKFRYYHCGEYGSLGRPHYHVCMFGQDFAEDRTRWKERNGWQTFVSSAATDLWSHGFVEIGQMDFSSAAYAAGYVVKKLNGPAGAAAYTKTDPDTGESWNVKPPYSTMSLKPGLGRSWYDRYKEDLYPEDVCIIDGRSYAVPQYYDKLLEEEDPALFAEIQKRRVDKAKRESPERLREIERNHELTHAFFDRRHNGLHDDPVF